MIRVGVDVGGTHTDLVLVDDEAGAVFVHKVPSTRDPSLGTIDGLAELCGASGIPSGAIEMFMHGTTIATNVALEHSGAATGLITTEGFRDILHIARHKRPQTFSLQLDLPWQSHPLVPRERRLTVAERVAASGEVIVPLDEAAARAAVRRLVAAGVEAIAVCFLFSFRNPAHERRVGEIVAEEAPGIFVSHSHQVVAQYREYERFSTAALNAYIGPKTARYLERLAGRLAGAGVRADLRLMQSSGGAATLEAALRRPVTLLMSGPAGGLPSRRGCCHPRPSQTRTSGFPASGSSRASFAHGPAYWWTIKAGGSGYRPSMARKRIHGRWLWRPRRASHFFQIRRSWWWYQRTRRPFPVMP